MTTHPPRRRPEPRPLPRLGLLALAAFVAAGASAPPAGAQEGSASPAETPPSGVTGQLAVIDAKLDRIAVALEAQQEMAQLELMLRRVESAERRIDGLETARLQARTYLGSLEEKRLVAEGLLAEAQETVKTGWPPGPRAEALRLRDEAEANLTRISEEIEGLEASLVQIEARVASLRTDAAAWSAMLESRLVQVTAGLATPAGSPPAAAASPAGP